MLSSETSIDDLPNEILDKIFSYVIPKIYDRAITPIYKVCRRWNRPFMIGSLTNQRIPKDIDFQTKFPKLAKFAFFSGGNKFYNDFSLFKGHAFLKKLEVYRTGLVPSVLNCPRLTSLRLEINSRIFFNDEHLEIFLDLLPQLEDLNLAVRYLTLDMSPTYIQMLKKFLQSRSKEQLRLKCLTLTCRNMDLVSIYELLQTSSLDHFETYNECTTIEHVRKIVECFPKLRSLEAHDSSVLDFNQVRFDTVTRLKLVATENLSISSLLNQFPNVESLDVDEGPIECDLEYPTRLTCSTMKFRGTVQPRLFGLLKTLYWTIDTDQFNYVMRELGVHCPHLNNLAIRVATDIVPESDNIVVATDIVPELENIVFPLLVSFELGSDLLTFNASLFRFLERHSHLQKILFGALIKFETDWKAIVSDQVLWPNLRHLSFHTHHDRKVDQFYDWFVKHAPKVKNPF